ncbi:MAG: hypothetical protein JOZ48_20175 [Acidobacteriaceae bacterium]|nr:hypothetical protein [Acidobacteriaceae bacterium]
MRLVFLVLAGTASLLSPNAASSQIALQLLHEMQAALGGAQNLEAIRDFDEIVKAETWDRNGRALGTVRKRVRWMRPKYLRIDQSGPYDTYVLFFDGIGGWEIMPDRSVKELAGGELMFAQNYLLGLDVNVWLADRDSTAVITCPAANTVVIGHESDPSRSTTITLDPITHLPLKQASTSHSDPSHPVAAYTALDQWRTTNGVKFPGRIRNFHEGRMLAEIMLEAIHVNVGMQASALSTKPPDLKPVMSKQ